MTSERESRDVGLKQWLRKSTRDQKMESISELPNVVMNTLRRLFLRADIQPILDMGYYDSVTEKYVHGKSSTQRTQEANFYNSNNMQDSSLIDSRNVVGNASAAFYQFNGASGYLYVIHHAYLQNDTRAPTTRVTCAMGTTTDYYNVTAALQSDSVTLVGNAQKRDNIGALPAGIKIGLNESLILRCDNFVAADVMEYGIIYDRIAVA